MKIPIQNIYYLLCYAWDRLEEAEIVDVRPEEITNVADLLARVLGNGVAHLLKRGVGRGYRTAEEELGGVRGKLDLSVTLKRQLWRQARTHCYVDELTHDIPHNQILKATLRAFLRVEALDTHIRSMLSGLYRRLNAVSDVTLTPGSFRTIQLHRNNGFYDFLLSVCQLVHHQLLVDEKTGTARFRDFVRDERAMPYLFERFVLNFLRREQDDYSVAGLQLRWHGVKATEADLAFLPVMRSDIALTSARRTIIIDAKFYPDAFQLNYGRRRVRSDHLYQLFAYLSNAAAANVEAQRESRGILLYPAVSEGFRLCYDMFGHRVEVRSVDLAKGWREIRQELLGLVA
jgi:5-methylcytosine-specific restriction enzyme subunit McrC